MRQPTFEERREARRNLANLGTNGLMDRWLEAARDARRRHRQWHVNSFVSFTPREAVIQDLALQLRRDGAVSDALTPGINWFAMAEAVLAVTPREHGALRAISRGVWRVVEWTFMALTARARQHESESVSLAPSANAPGGRRVAA